LQALGQVRVAHRDCAELLHGTGISFPACPACILPVPEVSPHLLFNPKAASSPTMEPSDMPVTVAIPNACLVLTTGQANSRCSVCIPSLISPRYGARTIICTLDRRQQKGCTNCSPSPAGKELGQDSQPGSLPPGLYCHHTSLPFMLDLPKPQTVHL
jgi:hypothetical protein